MKLRDAQAFAHEQMAAHGLLEQGWTFDFDQSKRRFGRCNSERKLITLSCYLTDMNSEAEVKDTVLHEIAHALVGVDHGHDGVWRRKAIAIGCDGNRCYDDATVAQPAHSWIGTCPTCGRTFTRHRRRRVSCSHCSPRFDVRHLIVWSRQ